MVDQKKRWVYTINPHFFWFEESGWPEKKSEVDCQFYLVKRQLRGGEGVKNCWFWDNIFYGWHLNCRSYFVKGISIGFPIRFHIHLKKFQEFNGFLKYVTFSIEFCPRRRIPEAIWILCLEFYKNFGGRILQKTVLIIK